jgi:eukaryotic-like serine/threonine-protein kinase
MNAVSIRGDWVGRVIDRRFSLLEWLGGSGTSSTFVTELDGPGSRRAAIKLFFAPAQAEERLSTWTATTSLSHVHLLRILHFGRAEVDGVPLVYVVTEMAEEVLSQIIPERPLTADEAREMIAPVLDALSYLHANGCVHGHLKPSNILVVENEVKLSADGVVIEGKPGLELESSDVHNAPETAAELMAPSADVWSLGVTLVEALTQQSPLWDFASKTEPVVPDSLPKPFDEITRECLRVDPARRCTLSDIRVLLEGKSNPAPRQVLPEAHPLPKMAEKSSRTRMPLVPLIVGFVLLLAIVFGLSMRSHKTETAPLQTETIKQAPTAEPEAQAPTPPGTTTGSASGEVLNRVMPEVSRQASGTIHGTVTVVVRASVDPSGTVTDAEFASHGPSAYFARVAMESARNWKFKAPAQNGQAIASTWLLRYQFKRDSVNVTPVEQ